MKPIRTFVQQSAIKVWLDIEKPIYKISKGRHARNLFLSSLDIPFVGTTVKIAKQTDTSTFIAKYKPDGSYDESDFKILTFTDLHLDEDYDINNKTLQMMINNIADVKPDLVIFTGDCILSKYQQIDAIQFGQLMEKLGVYWAYVFGNHEARAEKEYFKYLIFKSLTDFPHCLSKFGEPSLFGYGNYTINILNSDSKLRQSLVLFDSGRSMTHEHMSHDCVPSHIKDGYDYIKPSQIQWYKDEITALKKEYGDVTSMIYLHIPIPEYAEIFNAECEPDGEYLPTGKGDLLYGVQYESVGCSPYNSGLFDAMLEMGGQAIFTGHDHVNDWAARYKGVLLVYSQGGGYNCYGMGNYHGIHWQEKDWLQGATLTTLKKDGSVTLEQKKNGRFIK